MHAPSTCEVRVWRKDASSPDRFAIQLAMLPITAELMVAPSTITTNTYMVSVMLDGTVSPITHTTSVGSAQLNERT